MEPFMGEIIMFGGNFAPRGWAFCDGQLLPIAQNTALFSLLGTTYGGDGRTSFGLPDLRGRVAVHPGTGPGLSTRKLGQRTGLETTTLNLNNLAPHSHIIDGSNAHTVIAIPALADAADTAAPATNAVLATGEDGAGGEVKNYNTSDPADTTLAPFLAPLSGSITATNTGASIPFNNMQPFIAINYIIAMQGTYPSRS